MAAFGAIYIHLQYVKKLMTYSTHFVGGDLFVLSQWTASKNAAFQNRSVCLSDASKTGRLPLKSSGVPWLAKKSMFHSILHAKQGFGWNNCTAIQGTVTNSDHVNIPMEQCEKLTDCKLCTLDSSSPFTNISYHYIHFDFFPFSLFCGCNTLQ